MGLFEQLKYRQQRDQAIARVEAAEARAKVLDQRLNELSGKTAESLLVLTRERDEARTNEQMYREAAREWREAKDAAAIQRDEARAQVAALREALELFLNCCNDVEWSKKIWEETLLNVKATLAVPEATPPAPVDEWWGIPNEPAPKHWCATRNNGEECEHEPAPKCLLCPTPVTDEALACPKCQESMDTEDYAEDYEPAPKPVPSDVMAERAEAEMTRLREAMATRNSGEECDLDTTIGFHRAFRADMVQAGWLSPEDVARVRKLLRGGMTDSVANERARLDLLHTRAVEALAILDGKEKP